MIAPSGEQWEIRSGKQHAVIVEVGGGIRVYEVGGVPVLDPYPLEAICDGGHGAPLIPWPNRLAGGRYTWEGKDYQLALTEPAKANAIHGLLRWSPWRCLLHEESRVVVGVRLHPMQGWPFPLEVEIEYAVGEAGLRVDTRAQNLGASDAPFAAGQHPYLSAAGAIDDCEVTLVARERILVDDARSLPVGRERVDGGDYDFSAGRRIGEQKIDHAFADLERDAEGRCSVRLARADGHTVTFWADAAYPIVQLFTGDTLAPARRRISLACEPMSAPPNALATGEGVVRLAPGHKWSGAWGVSLDQRS